jgi:hypothetical protein
MAYQKLQAGTALLVIPANNINIPNASNRVATGTTSGTTGLTDAAATFDDFSISIGDIVYDTSNSVAARVTAIAATVLTLDDGNGVVVNLATAAAYAIYKDTNTACVLYVGGAGNLTVNMCNNGSTVLFTSALNGYHPIQVNRVLATGTAATNIIALW